MKHHAHLWPQWRWGRLVGLGGSEATARQSRQKTVSSGFKETLAQGNKIRIGEEPRCLTSDLYMYMHNTRTYTTQASLNYSKCVETRTFLSLENCGCTMRPFQARRKRCPSPFCLSKELSTRPSWQLDLCPLQLGLGFIAGKKEAVVGSLQSPEFITGKEVSVFLFLWSEPWCDVLSALRANRPQ